MQIEHGVRQLKVLTIILTEDEARAALADLRPLQDQLRVALNGRAPRRIPRKVQTRRSAPGRNGGGRARAAAGKGGFAKVRCPECPKMIAKGMLQVHLRAKHPGSARAADSGSTG